MQTRWAAKPRFSFFMVGWLTEHVPSPGTSTECSEIFRALIYFLFCIFVVLKHDKCSMQHSTAQLSLALDRHRAGVFLHLMHIVGSKFQAYASQTFWQSFRVSWSVSFTPLGNYFQPWQDMDARCAGAYNSHSKMQRISWLISWFHWSWIL